MTAVTVVLPAWTGCTTPGSSIDQASAAPVCATILSTNDTHGHLEPDVPSWSGGREVGGVATLGGYFARVRAESECPVFVLSAGDLMQGTLISNLAGGASTVAAMNALGYDALAIGNHEFDWGIDLLRERIGQAEFPFLGANIYLRGSDDHPEWARPYAILERDGVRVGVVGGTTSSTPFTTKPVNVGQLEFRSIGAALDRYIPKVRAEGVDFVVAVMHAGGFCDEQACLGEALTELGRTTARFDYAILGHTHVRIATEVHGVPVVQSWANTTAFGIGRLELGVDGRVVSELIDIPRTYADEVEPDGELARLVERYRGGVAADIDRTVADLAEPLGKSSPTGEYGLGRLIADAQMAATGSQVAIMNNGGIRRPLAAGPVSYGDLFELQPFQNSLILLQLRGADLLVTLEHALGANGRPDAHVSGLVIRYDPTAPRGSRILSAELDDGTPVRPDEIYSVAVNDFMAGGGSGYTMLTTPESSLRTGIVDLDALVAHLLGLPQPIAAPAAARWLTAGGSRP